MHTYPYKIKGKKFTTANLVIDADVEKSLSNGSWETAELQLCDKYIKQDDTVLELGGCLGVVSVVVNNMLNNPKNHVVVEANPKAAKILSLNKEKNDCHFHIENCMVFRDHSGKFYPASGSPQSGSTFIHNDGAIKYVEQPEVSSMPVPVPDPNQFDFDFIHLSTTTIEDLEQKYGIKFNVLIVDIEGGEFQFIKENLEILKRIDIMIIEFHQRFDLPECNEETYKEARGLLESVGLIELNNIIRIHTPVGHKSKNRETATEAWGRP